MQVCGVILLMCVTSAGAGPVKLRSEHNGMLHVKATSDDAEVEAAPQVEVAQVEVAQPQQHGKVVLFETSVQDAADAVNSVHSSEVSQTALIGAYAVALVAMVVVVTAMFYPLGFAAVFQVVLYVCCLAFVKIAMKAVFGYGYHYPKFVTSFHLFMSSFAAFMVLFYRKQVHGKEIALPTQNELLFGILPIALTFGLSIGSENSALVFVSAAFSEVVAASNPVMSALVTWACGIAFPFQLLAPIAVVVMGCVVSISGEVSFSAIGLILLLFAVFCRALKAVMQQKLMTGETKDKFDPVTLMAWTCGFSFFELLAYSAATEGKGPWIDLMKAPDLMGLSLAILASAVIAVTLNISALFVIKQLGAVGMQMVSQMKSLLVVIGGVALLGESFTDTQKVGFVTVLAGVYWYSYMKRHLEPAKKQ